MRHRLCSSLLGERYKVTIARERPAGNRLATICTDDEDACEQRTSKEERGGGNEPDC